MLTSHQNRNNYEWPLYTVAALTHGFNVRVFRQISVYIVGQSLLRYNLADTLFDNLIVFLLESI